MAALNGADLLVFTGGIGENDYNMRKMICSDMEGLGVLFDEEVNHGAKGKDLIISRPESKVTVMVITTDEEYVIASDTKMIVERTAV
jgi:acetate kinase